MVSIPLPQSHTAPLGRTTPSEDDLAVTEAERRRALYVVSSAEIVECTCPGDCERDHANE